MNEQTVYTPGMVGAYLRSAMDRDPNLARIQVRGEVSGYSRYSSGYVYFSLKDEESVLKCVIFPREAAGIRFDMSNGMQVRASGKITVFPKNGYYQMQCWRIVPEGIGDLHVAFERMKAKLEREGLFDPSRKKRIPAMPRCIALVTSPEGKAVRDMIRILGARWPMTRVRVVPVHVQGDGAAEEIANAIRWVNYFRAADLIITGRGGGSMEELWAFNEEVLARSIADSAIPVISAVGHEPDVTIADYVADLRASTPSNAAEKAVPDQGEVAAALQGMESSMRSSMNHRLEKLRQRLKRLGESRMMTDPTAYFRDRRLVLDYQERRLANGLTRSVTAQHTRLARLTLALPHGMENTLASRRQRMGRLAASLDALSPLKVLGRGYAIATREGTPITSVTEVTAGDAFTLRLADGSVDCQVTENPAAGVNGPENSGDTERMSGDG